MTGRTGANTGTFRSSSTTRGLARSAKDLGLEPIAAVTNLFADSGLWAPDSGLQPQ